MGVLGRGTLLHEKYRLDREIGRGGMGSVWSATRVDLGTEVAVKVMHGEASLQTGAGERFVREARAAARLSSPHVVRVIDIGVDAALDCSFLVMELLVGETLAQRLKTKRRLLPAEVGDIIAQVARALNEAHALGIVHRDLKPANLFLVRNEDQDLVKLLDFGIAKAEAGLDEALLTQTGNVLGTPHYMSPEQLHSSKGIDHRTDLWSLGVIACECLCGRRPFSADSLPQLAMKIALGRAEPPSSVVPVPLGFDDWFARATQVDPARRFQSAGELSKALLEVVGSGQRSELGTPSLGALDATAGAAVEALPTIATLSTTAQHSVELLPAVPSGERPRRLGRWRTGLLVTAAGAAGLLVALTVAENHSLAEHAVASVESARPTTAVSSAERAPVPPPLPSVAATELDAGPSEPEGVAAGPQPRAVAPKAGGIPQLPANWSRLQPSGSKVGRVPGTAKAGARLAPARPRANDKLDAYDWQ